MQQQPRSHRQGLGRGIEIVAQNGVPQRGQVQPNLMRAARHGAHFQPATIRLPLG